MTDWQGSNGRRRHRGSRRRARQGPNGICRILRAGSIRRPR